MSADTESKVVDVEVVEEAADGSAVIEVPEGMEMPQNEQEPVSASEQEQSDDDHPDDDEEMRAAKRARRRAKKEYVRQRNAEKDARLESLQRQNQELAARLAAMEQFARKSDLAKIDKEIQDEQLRLQYAMTKMREATDNSDGNSFVRAREIEAESRKRLAELEELKYRAEVVPQQEAPVNPKVKRMAQDWLDSNPWYDPEGQDEDTQIAKIIDARLTQEGWDPSSPDYWEELDNRLQKRLPHRYNETQDERPIRRPRSVVTGSVRESVSGRGSGNGYVLSPERVRAIKEAGMWDDVEKRNRMIKQFISYDKANRG